jgi:DNA-binding MarR family transcriptional regulator
MTAQAIVRVTLSHKSTISRAVSELETRRLIERVINKQDKRAYMLRLTKPGKTLVADLLPHVLNFEKSLLDRFSVAESKAIESTLKTLEREILHERHPT